MNKNIPSVTAVVPFFNGNDYLPFALNSILKNNYVHSVLVVVDLYSEAPLINVSDARVAVIYNQSKLSGAGIVRAIGYSEANTKYVAFLDCDDVWCSSKVEQQITQMEEYNLAFSFHDYQNFRQAKYLNRVEVSGPYNLVSFLKKEFTVGCLTVMVNKDLVPHLEPNALRKRNDYFMWYQLILYLEANNLKWGGLKFLGAYHRLHKGSLTHSKVSSAYHYYYFLGLCDVKVVKRVFYFCMYLWNSRKNR